MQSVVTLTIVYLHMYIVTVICTTHMYVVIAYHVIYIQFFFHHQNAVHIGGVISEAYRMMETTPANLSPTHLLQPFAPLTGFLLSSVQ